MTNARSTTHRRSRMLVAGAAALALTLAACGDSDDSAESSGGVEIEGAWARTSPMMASAGAAYLQITADEDTAIVAASVPSDVAGVTEIHETVMADMDGDTEMSDDMDGDMEMSDDMDGDMEMSDDMDGEHSGEMAMTMQEVASIALPAGETVSLEPGGFHVMMMELADPLEEGETFDLTLTLEDGTEVVTSVEVRSEAP